MAQLTAKLVIFLLQLPKSVARSIELLANILAILLRLFDLQFKQVNIDSMHVSNSSELNQKNV